MIEYFELLIPIVAICSPAIVIAIILYFNARSNEAKQQTLRELIKSGQEISPETIKELSGFKNRVPTSDIRRGAIVTGVGLGLLFLGYFGLDNTKVFGAGGLVAFIGLGFLIYGLMTENNNPKENSH